MTTFSLMIVKKYPLVHTASTLVAQVGGSEVVYVAIASTGEVSTTVIRKGRLAPLSLV